MLLVQDALHFLLVNDEHGARYSGCGVAHAKRLTRQATLAEKVARPQNGDDRFLAGFTNGSNLHSAFLYIHDAVGGDALRKDNIGSLKLPNFSRHSSRIEKRLGIECALFLGHALRFVFTGIHELLLSAIADAGFLLSRCIHDAIIALICGRKLYLHPWHLLRFSADFTHTQAHSHLPTPISIVGADPEYRTLRCKVERGWFTASVNPEPQGRFQCDLKYACFGNQSAAICLRFSPNNALSLSIKSPMLFRTGAGRVRKIAGVAMIW